MILQKKKKIIWNKNERGRVEMELFVLFKLKIKSFWKGRRLCFSHSGDDFANIQSFKRNLFSLNMHENKNKKVN